MKQIGTKEIKTNRLLLRKIRIDDANSLQELGCLHGSIEEIEKNIDNWIKQYANPLTYHWVIEYEKKAIGRIMVWEVSTFNEYCQLGYDVALAYRNKGIMTEALKAVFDYLLNQSDFNRIYLQVRTNNNASNKVCEKCGMKLEGIMEKHFKSQDSFDDVNIWGITKQY